MAKRRQIPFSPAALARINAEWQDWVEDTEDPHGDEIEGDLRDETPPEIPPEAADEDKDRSPIELLYGLGVPLSQWLEIDVPRVKWWVEGLVPAGSVILLSGHSKFAMKTTFAYNMALHLAAGKSYGQFEISQPGRVLFYQEEGSARVAQNHLRVLASSNLSGGLIKQAYDNFGMSYFPGIKLDNPAWKHILERELLEHKPALMIFDNFSYMLIGDESSHEIVHQAAETIRHLQKVAGQNQLPTSFMILLHLKKDARRAQKLAEQIRGSSVWRDYYDTHIALRFWPALPPTSGPRIVDLHVDHRGYEALEDKTVLWTIQANDSGDWTYAHSSVVDQRQFEEDE